MSYHFNHIVLQQKETAKRQAAKADIINRGDVAGKKIKGDFVQGEGKGSNGKNAKGSGSAKTTIMAPKTNEINIDLLDQVVRTVQKRLLRFSGSFAQVDGLQIDRYTYKSQVRSSIYNPDCF